MLWCEIKDQPPKIEYVYKVKFSNKAEDDKTSYQVNVKVIFRICNWHHKAFTHFTHIICQNTKVQQLTLPWIIICRIALNYRDPCSAKQHNEGPSICLSNHKTPCSFLTQSQSVPPLFIIHLVRRCLSTLLWGLHHAVSEGRGEGGRWCCFMLLLTEASLYYRRTRHVWANL